MKKRFARYMIFMLIMTYAFVGCSPTSVNDEGNISDIEVQTGEGEVEHQLRVFASFYPLYDFAKNVGGDLAEVKAVVPDGADPHSFEPSPRLIAEIESADVFIYNGLGMEPWIEGVLNILEGKDVQIVKASEGIELLHYDDDHHHDHDDYHSHDHDHDHDHHSHEHDHHHHGEYDPHIWVDPINASKISEAILDAFMEADPENTEIYEINYLRFKEELEELDRAFTEGLKNAANRRILVSHSAFGYLARRYDLEEISVAGVSPHGEPSPRRMAELTKKAQEYDLEYIFFEVLANPRTAEVLAQEANLKVMMLYNLEGLTKEQRDTGKNYVSLMYKNLENLKEALVK